MNETGTVRDHNNEGFLTILFSVLYLFTTYIYVYHRMIVSGMSDYPAHVFSILSRFLGPRPLEGWMSAPHCLWHLTVLCLFALFHIPLNAAAAFSTCLYSIFYYYVLLWVIRRVTAHVGRKETELRSNFIAFSFCFVQSLYFYWLDTGERYLGTFSPNPLHNPTQICVRGLAVLAFCLVVDLLSYENDPSCRPIFFKVRERTGRYYVLLAAVLFLSVLMKPTFAEMFIPAVAFFMLGTWISKLIRRDSPASYFRKCLVMLLCALPSLGYMLIQYIVFFFMEGSYGSEGGLIFTEWLEVWKLFSDNVFLSVLLGMAFPLYVILLDVRFFGKNIAARLAVIGYFVGFLEAALLGENGNRLSHANFMWPLMSGMMLVWLTALLHLMTLERTREISGAKRGLLLFGWFLFFCHVICGLVCYYVDML